MCKKVSILMLVMVMSLSGYSQEIMENFFTEDGGNSPITLNGDQKCGQRFTATVPFEGIEVNGPTWSVSGEKGMTLRLYIWEGSYGATVAQEPIVTRVLENLDDNGWFPLYAGAELPTGQYFWEASEPTNSNPEAIDPYQIGCWLWNASKSDGGEAYFNGEPYDVVTVNFIQMFSDNQTGVWTPFSFPETENPTLAQSFWAFTEFQGVAVSSPTWNGTGAGYQISHNKWDTDYDTTTAQTPIASRVIENHSDNARAELPLDVEQPVGQYLVLTDQPNRGTGNIGHWGWMDSGWSDNETIAYADGIEIEGYFSFDLFLGEPSAEVAGKDFASRSLTGVATATNHWSLY